MNDGLEEIKIIPPVPGSCPICAAFHDKAQPHDRDSLYYQNHFYKKNGRFPTWEDAMSHCTDIVKREFRERLIANGIILEVSERRHGRTDH